jgi:hypothetical protein
VRQAFGFIVEATRARQALLELSAIESHLGKPPWRNLLKELRHDRGLFYERLPDILTEAGPTWPSGASMPLARTM